MIIHPLVEEMVSLGFLTEAQSSAVKEEQSSTGNSIRSILIDQGYVSEGQYLKVVAHLLGAERVDLRKIHIDEELVGLLPGGLARMYKMLPFKSLGGMLTLVVSDVPDPAATDEVSFALSRPVNYAVAPFGQVEGAIERFYGNKVDDSVGTLLSALETDLDGKDTLFMGKDDEELDSADVESVANATPVIRFVNLVLYQAVKDRASDIHFEPFENEFKIRYRVDGALYEMAPPPQQLALPVISRIKVIAGLDISEMRLPQDGRINLDVAGHSIDFRVSTLPTQFGESVVLRVLDRSNVQLDIDNIGFPDDIKQGFLGHIQRPNGIVIVTGPTGSGKTTTLYAALQHINRVENKILTAEDPVEYDVEGILQLPIRENIGLTFAAALRSFLRQDPDVIMVGEIRDLETAQIAIQASLTGHLVFSTLHTNDAAGTITRLIDMDVDPFLIASTLNAVLGQRLVRTICPSCKVSYAPDQIVLGQLGLSVNQVGARQFCYGSGCADCSNMGYAGRRAIFELMQVSDALRSNIIDKKPTLALRNCAIEGGMRTLREDGIRAILDGYTTVEEVVQYT